MSSRRIASHRDARAPSQSSPGTRRRKKKRPRAVTNPSPPSRTTGVSASCNSTPALCVYKCCSGHVSSECALRLARSFARAVGPPPPPLLSRWGARGGRLSLRSFGLARFACLLAPFRLCPLLPYPRNLNLSGTSSSTPRLALAQLHQGSGLGFEQTVKPWSRCHVAF